MDKAERIWRLLAGEDPPTFEEPNGWDDCALCLSRLPYGQIGERQAGTVCPRHPDDSGHYPDGSIAFCGEVRIPRMVEVRGIIHKPEYHDIECPWRLAKELAAESPEDDGRCHRVQLSGDCSLPRDHPGYCDWEGR